MRGKRGKTLWLQKRTDTDTDTDTRRVLGYTHCCNGFIPSVLLFVIFRGILTGSAAFLVHSRTWHICLLANLSIAIFVFSSKNLLTRRSLPFDLHCFSLHFQRVPSLAHASLLSLTSLSLIDLLLACSCRRAIAFGLSLNFAIWIYIDVPPLCVLIQH
ncbi:hypothetical protein AcV5_008235 [Taiwanofungus camphoratus]|nr:hypothetical protein AcV5_008235 [Antrodia cinnamomea]KAI0955613.1 hypothetical protein AcV7_006233 [Antrodia cinnamomea]